jgi:hypothetical protein
MKIDQVHRCSEMRWFFCIYILLFIFILLIFVLPMLAMQMLKCRVGNKKGNITLYNNLNKPVQRENEWQ